MKKFLLIAVCFCFKISSFSQTLFTYGNHTVSKQEFLRAYNKNQTAVTDKQAALKEYLNLYINFKLKVQAAKDMRMDTLPALINDLESFRTQIETSYLYDEQEIQRLENEAFLRSKKDIHFAYLFIPIENISDTNKVISAAKKAYRDISSGNKSFITYAETLNQQGFKAQHADGGFISAFTLPYNFETEVYKLKAGETGKPYRAKTGFYIFRNIEERPSAGKIKAAQILIAVPQDATNADKKAAYDKADSIYKLLIAGADFAALAAKESHDRLTNANGGIMEEFSAGKYAPEFEAQVFALKNNDEITNPFLTGFGYHIVKQLQRTFETGDTLNSNQREIIRQRILQDSRVNIAKDIFLKRAMGLVLYKKNLAVKETDLFVVADTFLISNKIISRGKVKPESVLFSLGNKKFPVKDWLEFAKNYQPLNPNADRDYSKILKAFTDQSVLDVYRRKLDNYNSDFKFQLQEFKDGDMLFEIMDKNIWTKAAADNAALETYYEGNKAKYIWQKSADAIVIITPDSLKNVITQALQTLSFQVLKEKFPDLQIDSARYETSQIPVTENLLNTGKILTAARDNGLYSIVKIIKMYPADMQRSFEEARGAVLNDYQNVLEAQWIKELKIKYPVKINQQVFQTLLR